MWVELELAVMGSGVAAHDPEGAPYVPGYGEPAAIGREFLTNSLVAFEVASMLLLIAAVGAVILARRRSGLADPREVSVSEFMRTPLTKGDEPEGTMIEAGGPAQL